MAFAKRDGTLREQYNRSTHYLKPLEPQIKVLIQNKGKWDRDGRMLECLLFRQYGVRMSGSGQVTLRNCRYPQTCNDS